MPRARQITCKSALATQVSTMQRTLVGSSYSCVRPPASRQACAHQPQPSRSSHLHQEHQRSSKSAVLRGLATKIASYKGRIKTPGPARRDCTKPPIHSKPLLATCRVATSVFVSSVRVAGQKSSSPPHRRKSNAHTVMQNGKAT